MTAVARLTLLRSMSVEGAGDGKLDAQNKRPCDPEGRFERWHPHRSAADRELYLDAYRRAYARHCVTTASAALETR